MLNFTKYNADLMMLPATLEFKHIKILTKCSKIWNMTIYEFFASSPSTVSLTVIHTIPEARCYWFARVWTECENCLRTFSQLFLRDMYRFRCLRVSLEEGQAAPQSPSMGPEPSSCAAGPWPPLQWPPLMRSRRTGASYLARAGPDNSAPR